jgi:hypothetical protein
VLYKVLGQRGSFLLRSPFRSPASHIVKLYVPNDMGNRLQSSRYNGVLTNKFHICISRIHNFVFEIENTAKMYFVIQEIENVSGYK